MQLEGNPSIWDVQPTKAFGQKFWLGLALLTVTAIAIASLFWLGAHPFSTNWDEGRYINRAYRDVAAFRQGGILELLKAVIGEDRTRPPAYRLLVLPLTLLLGAKPLLLRLVGLACMGVSVWLTFLMAKRIAGLAAGAFAVVFLTLCPIVVAPSLRFYVDYPYYLAIAATLYFLLADWDRDEPSRNWIGLGLSLGLGALAKPPFFFLMAPVGLLTLGLVWLKWIAGPRLSSLIKACTLGTLIALPWWAINVKPGLAKALKSSGYVRHSLGARGSPEAIGNWFYTFVQTLLGPALTLLFVAIVVTVVLRLVQKRLQLERFQLTAIALCLTASLPTLLTSIFATNQNPRLIAPTLLPLAIAIGALAALTGWTTSRWLAAAATVLFCFQLAVMVSPTPGEPRYQAGDSASKSNVLLWGNPSVVMRRSEQWDWSKLRDVTIAQDIRVPRIGYLGNGGGLAAPQLAFPWIAANEPIEVRWLWRFEDNLPNGGNENTPPDWTRVMASVDASNVVVTALDVVGSTADKQDIDNRYNAELIERMRQRPEFLGPVELKLGRFNPARVLVFLRKSESSIVTSSDPKPKQLEALY